MGDREGHLRDVWKDGAELAGEAGGRLRFEVSGVVEKILCESEQAAAGPSAVRDAGVVLADRVVADDVDRGAVRAGRAQWT